ncbi:Cytochrome c2 precursor [Shimia thalassica]|uniref:Cytochrome c2 n=1 Tax=Shimia thalassica TaxID=1715693 RepID=A0A0P1I4X0_9RHOB|nr:c-type cytochrome [Shimia thalassica]CUJ90297.1 Cytochrome c2 precursor [Shimia thalassica]
MARRFILSFTVSLWAGAMPAQTEEFATLKGHGGPIMDIAVTDQGQVATASFDNSVGLWTDVTPSWLEAHDAAVTALASAPDGTIASAGDDYVLYRWTGKQAEKIGSHKGKINGLAFSPDGTRLASASWDGTVGIWGADVPPIFLSSHQGGANDVAFSADGLTLYVATMTGQLVAYDMSAPFEMRLLVSHGFGINRLITTPDWIAYGAVDGGTRVITHEGQNIADLTLERRPILSMDYSPQSRQMAVGDGHGFIMVVDTDTWSIARDFRATRKGPVWALAFSPDGAMIYAGGLDDAAYRWPVTLLSEFDPAITGERAFLRAADTMPNGERQYTRKCAICHAITPPPSRKAGPTLFGVFGRKAGTLPDYRYSSTLLDLDIIWSEETIDQLFDLGPDHYIPGSKMPQQRITGQQDRADLIDFLKHATSSEN